MTKESCDRVTRGWGNNPATCSLWLQIQPLWSVLKWTRCSRRKVIASRYAEAAGNSAGSATRHASGVQPCWHGAGAMWPRVPYFTISSVAYQRLGWAALAPQALVFVGNSIGAKVQPLGDHISLVGSRPVPLVPTATPILEQSELGPRVGMENTGQADLQVLGLGCWPHPRQG